MYHPSRASIEYGNNPCRRPIIVLASGLLSQTAVRGMALTNPRPCLSHRGTGPRDLAAIVLCSLLSDLAGTCSLPSSVVLVRGEWPVIGLDGRRPMQLTAHLVVVTGWERLKAPEGQPDGVPTSNLLSLVVGNLFAISGLLRSTDS
jgi:hypothetical protein